MTDKLIFVNHTQLTRHAQNMRRDYPTSALRKMGLSQQERALSGQACCVQPLVVTVGPGIDYDPGVHTAFTIVAGHLRHAGNAWLGEDAPPLPCIVRFYATDAEMLADMGTENGVREDVGVISWALYLNQQISAGVRMHELLKRTGLTLGRAELLIDLAGMPAMVQGVFDRGELPLGALKPLKQISDRDQLTELAVKLGERRATLQQVEMAVKAINGGKPKQKYERRKPAPPGRAGARRHARRFAGHAGRCAQGRGEGLRSVRDRARSAARRAGLAHRSREHDSHMRSMRPQGIRAGVQGLSAGRGHAQRGEGDEEAGRPRGGAGVTIDTLIDRVAWATSKPRRIALPQRWSKAELSLLHELVGQKSLTAIARELGRSRNAIASKLKTLGYGIKADVQRAVGVNAVEMAAMLGVPYEQVVRDIHAGVIKGAYRESRKDFMVPYRSMLLYGKRMQQIRDRREKAIARIKVETLTKQEAMKLIGLSETHMTRYLQGKIIKAWKIPTAWTDTKTWRWEWLVSKADAERVRDLRAAGRLHLRMRKKAYRDIVQPNNERIKQLRREHREGTRIARPFGPRTNAVVPGCYTIAQVSQIVGISAQQVYQHAENGRLEAMSVRVGRRNFRAISPEALEAYKAWCARPVKATGPMSGRKSVHEKIHQAGLITAKEAAERYGVIYGTLIAAVNGGRVEHRRINGMLAFKAEDVEAYAASLRQRKSTEVITA
jgi:hypothetical protein